MILRFSIFQCLCFSLCHAVQHPIVAHFMLGTVYSYTQEDWRVDFTAAKDMGLSAFALNCANEATTTKQLPIAYFVAQEMNFKLFISFDMNSFSQPYWGFQNSGSEIDSRPTMISLLNTYIDSPAQFLYRGKAVISTFGGDIFPWLSVTSAITTKRKVAVMPNFQNVAGLKAAAGLSGALSWLAWPTDGNNGPAKRPMTISGDKAYAQALGNRAYIAPVGPWFYTHMKSSTDFGDRGKNWLFVCEDLIFVRWQQLLTMSPKPAMIELLTWNDYGESHYIGPMNRKYTSDNDGSIAYSNNQMPHDAFRQLQKLYIDAFQAGRSKVTPKQDQLFYWYRPHPKAAKASDDPLPPPTGWNMVNDQIFIVTALTQSATLIVRSGNLRPQTYNVKKGMAITKAKMGIGAQSFSLKVGHKVILSGTAALKITDRPNTYNFNVFAGMLPVKSKKSKDKRDSIEVAGSVRRHKERLHRFASRFSKRFRSG